MSILPNELLLLALAQLPLDSICVAGSVCSHWRKLVVDNDQHLFASEMLLLFPLMNPIRPHETNDSYRLRFLRASLGRIKGLPNQIIHTRLFYELQLLDQEPPTVDIQAIKIDTTDNQHITIHNNELIPANMTPLFAEDVICRHWATDQSSVSYIRDKMLVRNGIETDLSSGEATNKLSHYDLRKCYIDTMCIFSVGDRTYVVRLKSSTAKCLSAQMSGDTLYCIISDHQWTVVRVTSSGEQTEVVIGDQELTPLLQVLHGHVFVEQPSVSYTSTVYYVNMDSRISYKLYRTDGMGSGLPCAVLDGFIYVYYGVDRRRRFNRQMIKLFCDFGSKQRESGKQLGYQVPVYVACIQYTDSVDLAGGTHTKILSDATGAYCLSHDFVKTSGHLWRPRDHQILQFEQDEELFQKNSLGVSSDTLVLLYLPILTPARTPTIEGHGPDLHS
ncbi:hypothetical protein BKA91DRAFT_168327 [Yarrowia lipolytica]|nr:hypothetical protein BKA91DRAFT_168327 [Yarrowia lipolytica]KAE8173869.1 hypothetical protein BKA90DRAFT_166996 [Yarrowia lipolytica]RMI95857.1 hypothetical protein BD777DRAFT_154289 [Yarrowia lipolytica]